MGFTNKTPNYDLPQWIGTDQPTWLVDVNGAFSAIDTAISDVNVTATGAKNTADSASGLASTAKDAADAATQAATDATTAATAALRWTKMRLKTLNVVRAGTGITAPKLKKTRTASGLYAAICATKLCGATP